MTRTDVAAGDRLAGVWPTEDWRGETGAIARALDWSATPLGAIDGWSPALRGFVRMVMASAQPMYLVWGPSLTAIYNDGYIPFLGTKHPGAFGARYRDTWAEIWDQFGPLVAATLDGESQLFVEQPMRLAGRAVEESWFDFCYTPLRDDTGLVAGFVAIATETTDKVAARRALAVEREQLAQMFEQAPTIMAMLTGPDHRLERANAGYMRLVGDRPVIGRPIAQALPDAVAQGYLALLDEVWASGLPYIALGARYAVQAHPDDAPDERFLDFVFQPIRDDYGVMRGIFVEGADVTDRVLAEQALRELNLSLEARIAAAIDEQAATQEALRQAQKMEAVGQLTGGLAHDFNNLLTGMMGNLELLQARIARGETQGLDRFITAAQGAGRRAATLTQRLLAFSRRQTLDPRPVDVNRLIAGMEDLLRQTVGATTDVEVVGADGLWTAMIDAGQLENALLNLCINGRDAMPDGGRLTIETVNQRFDDRTGRDRDLPPGEYVAISVTDTGTGMAPATIERAFEPFYTTKPIGKGTGLGLSMIYGFARQSGGQVRIYSELGSGTTVSVYLPRHHGDAPAIPAAPPPAEPRNARGETILVVDDEATIRHLVDEVLNERGYTVIGAADGAAGIKVLQSGARIELLITDVGLPGGMNGRQVADAARLLRPDMKILFITGYAENVAVGGHLDRGMELLTKPFTIDALAEKVADMLKVPANT